MLTFDGLLNYSKFSSWYIILQSERKNNYYPRCEEPRTHDTDRLIGRERDGAAVSRKPLQHRDYLGSVGGWEAVWSIGEPEYRCQGWHRFFLLEIRCDYLGMKSRSQRLVKHRWNCRTHPTCHCFFSTSPCLALVLNGVWGGLSIISTVWVEAGVEMVDSEEMLHRELVSNLNVKLFWQETLIP